MSNDFKANRLICSGMNAALCIWHKYSLNSCAYLKLALVAQFHGGLCVRAEKNGMQRNDVNKLKFNFKLIKLV